jgi:uncharacterized membrane protein
MGARAVIRPSLRWLLALVMIGAGVLHFVAEPFFTQIVPPFLPAPRLLVWLSGFAEMLLGAGLLVTRTRRLAGYGLVALYIAVFPANIYMAVANVQLHDMPKWFVQPSPAALFARLPLQILFIALALWVSRARRQALTSPMTTAPTAPI